MFLRLFLPVKHGFMTLNLPLAWSRVCKEYGEGRPFVRLPYEVEIIKGNSEKWLAEFEAKITSGDFRLRPVCICEVPKPNYHIRPGAHLAIEDAVYYTALVGDMYSFIHETTVWARDRYDFSHVLTGEKDKVKWLRGGFDEWKNFRTRSIGHIRGKMPFVVISDIAGYYENISFELLASDLRQIGVPNELIVELSRCLNKWAQGNGKGLPQGYVASDILAKLYLNSVDRQLKTAGYIHSRYVDDMRIFCESKVKAKQAIIELSALLRKRGLNFQSAKTKIYIGKEAVDKIEGVQPIIEKILRDIEKPKTVKLFASASDSGYFDLELESIFRQPVLPDPTPEKVPIEVIKQAFSSFFINNNKPHFDKTLFRFLLKRLQQDKDHFAVNYCKDLFEVHPEETTALLRYFSEIGAVEQAFDALEKFLCSDESIYSYQNYQIVEWMDKQTVVPSENLQSKIRGFAFSQAAPYYLKSMARKYISHLQELSDLEAFEDLFKNSLDTLEQVELLCCLGKMDKGRKNTLAARMGHTSYMHKAAISYIRPA